MFKTDNLFCVYLRLGKSGVFVLLFAVFYHLATGLAAPGPSVSLEGFHRFRPGDDPEWASPHYDDSSWQEISIPGSWQSQGIEPKNGMGWYRIHFSLPKGLEQTPLAVSLGNIGNVDETYLNGVKIGGEGKIGPGLVDATVTERLYKMPEDLLKFNGENVLAVRVLNFYWQGGIFSGSVVMGDYRTLLVQKKNRDFQIMTEEIFVFAVFLFFVITCFFFYTGGIKGKEYAYFGLFALNFGMVYFAESLVFYNTGLKTSPIQMVSGGLLGLLPMGLLCFVVQVLKYEFNKTIKFLLILSFLISLDMMLFAAYRYSFYTFSKWLWMFELILICSVVTYLSIRAYIAKRYESGPILLGVGALVLAGLLEMTNVSHFNLVEDIQMFDYPFLFFMLCMPYALAKRYVRLQSRIKLLSGKILTAQEGERKRLARELHDGLGQGLLAVKLNLQRINQRYKSDLTEGVIREVSSSIKELQDISRGLRPAFLDDMGLEAAIRDYCSSLSEKADMAFEVRGNIASRPGPHIEENLFRIFQEATSNAIKHSKGNRVIISLKSSRRMISMEVRDNGIGLDSFEGGSGTNGLGMTTMEERATLMGGNLDAKREKDGGTLIRVEVPLK